jgi:phospholipase/carboxylesterase
MHEGTVKYAGNQIHPVRALILLHGRGGDAEDILSLAADLEVGDYLLAAPQATNNSWYPNSFLALPALNEPWLSSALDLVHRTVMEIQNRGIAGQHIYFSGFSQGACLTLEYVTRHARLYGGVAAFTGGLIGDKIYAENYTGDFAGTNIFIGSSDPDPHVPVTRVHASTALLEKMNARVTEKIYDRMGHTIIGDEIANANKLIFK